MNQRMSLFFVVCLLSAMLLAACGARYQASESIAPAGPFFSERAASGQAAVSYDYDPAGQPVEFQFQAQERLIIRTGELSIVVRDTDATLAAIGRLVNSREGWVVSSNIYKSGEGQAKTAYVTVRIPAAQFENTISEVKELASEVTRETTSGQDVTEEYVDLSARLRNLEATAARVRSFLDNAQDVKEALAVNQELSRLEGEIEAMKGRLQFLSQSAAFSTLTVTITPDSLAQPIQIAGWRPQGTAREAVMALFAALQGIADLAIWLVIFLLPLGLVVVVPGWLLVRAAARFWRRRGQKPVVAS
jgi:hypothetical protein